MSWADGGRRRGAKHAGLGRFDEQGARLRSGEAAEPRSEGGRRAVPAGRRERRPQPHELRRSGPGGAGEAPPRERESSAMPVAREVPQERASVRDVAPPPVPSVRDVAPPPSVPAERKSARVLREEEPVVAAPPPPPPPSVHEVSEVAPPS